VSSQVADEMSPGQTFGRLLRSYRVAAGLTQEELAELSGLSVRTLGDIERGRITRPYRNSLMQLADALQLTETARQQFLGSGRAGTAQKAAVGPAPGDAGPSARIAQIIPRQMPASVPYFAGRADELSTLTTLLCPAPDAGGARVVVITGTAGTGKTALALHWAASSAGQFPHGQLYLNLRGFDPSGNPVTPGEAIREFLGTFGISDDRIPVSPEAQAGLYRSVLADRRVLIVLDNARDAAQVRPLLPGASASRVVVTSRDQLSGLLVTTGAELISLGVLAAGEARRMLALRLGTSRLAGDSGAVNALLALTARLPLALAIVAARAATRQDFPLSSFVDGLTEASSRLDSLDVGDEAASVRAAFSWSYQNLSDLAARVFRLLGVHPGPDITAPVAASLAALPLERARKALTELTAASLLTEHVPDRYSIHDLLRVYAVEQCLQTESDSERRAAIQRILDHYLITADRADRLLSPIRRPLTLVPPSPGVVPGQHSGLEQAMAWLKAEHQVLLASVQLAERANFDTHAWQLAHAMATFLDRQAHWNDLTTTQEMAIAAAERTGDLHGQGAALRSLAEACSQLGMSDDARRNLQRALDLYRDVGDLHGLGVTELDLARVNAHQDKFGESLPHAQEALRLVMVTGNRSGQARAFNAVGWSLAQLGDYEQGLRLCLKSIGLFRDLGDRRGEAATWDSVAFAHYHLGHYEEAFACFDRSLELLRSLSDRYFEAAVLGHIGDARDAAGQPQAAAVAFQQALNILNELHHPYADDIASKLRQLDGTGPMGSPRQERTPAE
jgi:tetratricopeptide (TPR) repeat protein/transcriptional regulator with XRE-family HTH domain